jgi:hypothetical protein
MPEPTDPLRPAERQQRVDLLARAYPYTPVRRLLPRAQDELRALSGDYAGRWRNRHTDGRDLLVSIGWTLLLGACLEQDAGHTARAAHLAELAATTGWEAEAPAIAAWAAEIRAWQAIIAEDYPAAVVLARDAADAWPGSSGTVQLRMQQAMAHAGLGERAAARWCLNEVYRLQAALPATDFPEHHFVVDGRKLSFYAARVYGLAGDLAPMREAIAETLAGAFAADGSTRWPMRVAGVQLEAAIGAVTDGQLDEAFGLGVAALKHQRGTASTLPRAADLERALRARWPKERKVGEYGRVLFAARRAYAGA